MPTTVGMLLGADDRREAILVERVGKREREREQQGERTNFLGDTFARWRAAILFNRSALLDFPVILFLLSFSFLLFFLFPPLLFPLFIFGRANPIAFAANPDPRL